MGKQLHILLVDDSDFTLALLQTYLRDLCPEPVACMDGKQALEVFKSQQFDMVIMDVMMPVMNGVEATQGMREHEREKGQSPVPILLLSGNDTPDEILRYARSGISAFLPKPITREDLLEAVQRHSSPF